MRLALKEHVMTMLRIASVALFLAAADALAGPAMWSTGLGSGGTSSGGITVGAAVTGGTNDRVFYQSAGLIAQSANLTFDGTTLTTSAVNVTGLTASKVVFTDASKNLTSTGTVSVGQGGTGATTLTIHGVLLGNTTSAVNVSSAGTAGQCFTSNGAGLDPTFQSCTGSGANTALSNLAAVAVNADLIAGSDNTLDLGSTALRWKTLHVGPGSVVVHNDNTNTVKVSLAIVSSEGNLSTTATMPLRLTTGANSGIAVSTGGDLLVGGDAVASQVRWLEPSGSGTNYTGFKAVAQAADLSYSLPPAFGAAGSALTDVAGNGVLTWVVPSGSGVTGSGTTTFVPKWTSSTALGDSIMYDDGAGHMVVASSTSSTFNVDSVNQTIASGNPNAFVRTTDSQASDRGGTISVGGVYTGSSQIPFASISGRKENSTDANTAGYFSIATRPNGGAMVEHVHVDSLGNVGVNTAAPNGELEVSTASGAADLWINSASGNANLVFATGGTTNGAIEQSPTSSTLITNYINNSALSIIFRTVTSSVVTNRMMIENNGTTTHTFAGATNTLYLGANTTSGETAYNVVSLNGSTGAASGTRIGLTGGGGSDANLYVDANSGGVVRLRSGSTDVVDFGSTKATFASGVFVGIGSSTPKGELDVESSSTTNVNRGITSGQHSSSVHGATITFEKSRGTLASPTAVANADFLGDFAIRAYDGTSYIQPTSFGAFVNGTVGTNSVPTDFYIATGSADDGAAANKKLVITSAGEFNVTGNVDINASGTNHIKLGQNTSVTTYNSLAMNGNNADGSRIGLTAGGGTDPTLYLDAKTGGSFYHRVNNTQVMLVDVNSIGSCTLDGAATPICTHIVDASCTPVCSSTTTFGGVACAQSGGTLTVTGLVTLDTSVVNYHCF